MRSRYKKHIESVTMRENLPAGTGLTGQSSGVATSKHGVLHIKTFGGLENL
jgi:hypothetical protein